MKRSWPRHPRGGWSSSMSGKFSGNTAAMEGQAWADLERGFSGDLHTLLPPGLLDSCYNCPYSFSCIQCMHTHAHSCIQCMHTHAHTHTHTVPGIASTISPALHTHTDTHLLRTKVRTCLPQQKSHQHNILSCLYFEMRVVFEII